MSARHEAPRRPLDLADIQGNIVRPYGRFGFPVTRHMFFNIGNAAAGRNFVETVRHGITTAERWSAVDGNSNSPARPLVAINIGFSYRGLAALSLPTRTLSRLPEEFIDGMAKRWSILGDIGPSAPEAWDEIWQQSTKAASTNDTEVHVWLSLNAQAGADGKPVPALEERTAWLKDAAVKSGGVTLLTGHRGSSAEYQDSSAIMQDVGDGGRVPTAKENFGFTDGIADPAFAGQYEPREEAEESIGGGKLAGAHGWAPLATGEFVLGHAGEAQELPPTTVPWSFVRNGTFMVYRKLHQNIGSFTDYVKQQAALLARVDPGLGDAGAASQTVRAKMVGRWPSGIPLAVAPTYEEALKLEREWADIPALQAKADDKTPADRARIAAYERLITNFRYKDDVAGARCPVSAHIRRTNPRDALDPKFGVAGVVPDSALTNRRRIMRRGLPYGDSTAIDNSSEHGVIFIAIAASLFRQFEFVQQQWVQYGASFNVGNDTDPLVGLRRDGAKFVIPGDAARGKLPFICANIPQFVETRGGEYFFVPSLTALREIAQGSVDPT